MCVQLLMSSQIWHRSSQSAACGSTDHSLREIKLLIPLADAAAVLHTTPFATLMEFALIKQARAAYAEAFSW
jgi:hypothetical protein